MLDDAVATVYYKVDEQVKTHTIGAHATRDNEDTLRRWFDYWKGKAFFPRRAQFISATIVPVKSPPEEQQ